MKQNCNSCVIWNKVIGKGVQVASQTNGLNVKGSHNLGGSHLRSALCLIHRFSQSLSFAEEDDIDSFEKFGSREGAEQRLGDVNETWVGLLIYSSLALSLGARSLTPVHLSIPLCETCGCPSCPSHSIENRGENTYKIL